MCYLRKEAGMTVKSGTTATALHAFPDPERVGVNDALSRWSVEWGSPNGKLAVAPSLFGRLGLDLGLFE